MADSDGASTGADSRGHTRRAILVGAAVGASAATARALSNGGTDGNLYGGTMALSQAYNVAGDLWIGPDSAKDTVDPDTPRVYVATDTEEEYYGDGTQWTGFASKGPTPILDSLTLDDTTT